MDSVTLETIVNCFKKTGFRKDCLKDEEGDAEDNVPLSTLLYVPAAIEDKFSLNIQHFVSFDNYLSNEDQNLNIVDMCESEDEDDPDSSEAQFMLKGYDEAIKMASAIKKNFLSRKETVSVL